MSIKVTRKDSTSTFLGLVVNKTVFFSAIAVVIFSVRLLLFLKMKPNTILELPKLQYLHMVGGFTL